MSPPDDKKPDPERSPKALLGPGGPLSQVLPGYEPRTPQLQMAQAVGAALGRGRALVVEAGTGTGKTLAYLLPAALSGIKVVVSTATKNLQEQLADKDVPLLRSLGVDATVAFMKGRQNYLCLLRKEQFERQPTFQSREEAAQSAALDRWAERTETGDRAELTELPEGAEVFNRLTSTADTCTGQKCGHYDRCFVFKMRRRAADADVIVVNHHLFFADLALRSSSAGDLGAAVIPKYDAVIFDEAHAVEEVATEHFGAQISSRRVAEIGRDSLAVLSRFPNMQKARDAAAALVRDGAFFFEAALTLREQDPARRQLPQRTASRARGRAQEKPAMDSDRWPLPPGALVPAENERQLLVELLRNLGSALSAPGTDGEKQKDDELSLLERRCVTLAGDLALFAPPSSAMKKRKLEAAGVKVIDVEPVEASGAPKPPEQHADGLVRWAEQRGGNLLMHASPLDIGGLLQDRLYDKIGPVVFTSATLAVGGSLAYFTRAAGLADQDGPVYPTDELVLASPFDYEHNAVIYLPPRMPEPQDDGFIESVTDELRKLIPITGGRAFALFTSLRNMRRAHELLAEELREAGLRVLLQGEAPKAELLRLFKERDSVLFASQSFWEGVDVQGDALQLVVIDKLPFASPQEPLTAARIERLRQEGGDPFGEWQVPQAALALKQGFGRLIRTASDRGVVAILDRRLLTRSYGKQLLSALPPACRTEKLEDVETFFREG
jgi:ATP-dependent DNA helicase DinG